MLKLSIFSDPSIVVFYDTDGVYAIRTCESYIIQRF